MELSQKTREALTGRTIVRVSGLGIHLDNGKAIYLEETEIEHLNDFYDPEDERPLLDMMRDISEDDI